ncbi:ectoine/hydroxyectoine ABC transporter substrate-binding protein EhuB [Halomonas sp. SSL-5]|uniref:ectoine/hydroxyectoine ABC transporter substrate-binding protein EhuB n=1 Tax=Halomonas sp. SSL-5 TaxID=3065855 RepID=UPI00273A3E4A|nr:ectoine/hydroxyectoine ABC transporter substrate-binding protein EhuB [Halomonas sp. SSL-5]MDY7115807.1 ectoine/hydroxyectoine ABC transporter substrate-binding protein EhuB [Halomonas sp. SSL-5]
MERTTPTTVGSLGIALFATLATLPGAVAAASLEELRERGHIRVAVADEEPYGYLDAEGEGRGAGPDVARPLLERLGIERIEWQVVDFEDLIPGLEQGEFDMAAAEMAIRPERCKRALFSEPNTSYGEGLLVQAANPHEINAYDHFAARDDIRVAVLAGATQVDILSAMGVPEDRLVVIDTNAQAVDTILGGDADAYAGTGLTVSQLAEQDIRVEVAQNFVDPEVEGEMVRSWGGFAFPPDAESLRDAFNEALRDYRNTGAWEETLIGYGFTQDDILNAFRFDTEWLCGRQ